jgi:deoxycytidylate deaminase
MSQVDRGFSVALAASLLSNAPRSGLRLGAALYHGSRLLSIGANRWQSHPDSENNSEFCRNVHAEHCCLIRRQHYSAPNRMTLFVARQRDDGSYGCSKPCNNCTRLAQLAGVARIWYFDDNGKHKEMKL